MFLLWAIYANLGVAMLKKDFFERNFFWEKFKVYIVKLLE
jgi:hypothetical protein